MTSQIDMGRLRAECLVLATRAVPDIAAAERLADRMCGLVIAAATPAPLPPLVSAPANTDALTSFPPSWFREPTRIDRKP
ncbi:MAG: hypothetical protein PW843_24335 [Azospirillaceae bacterium]|nr:hypothetical protein [Azospirillaceae bacterium]